MNPHIDVVATCKAIKSLLELMNEAEQIRRVELFATIKTLCEAIQAQAEDEEAWSPYTAEKMLELLFSTGAMAGIRGHNGMIPPDSLAWTALDSLENSYLDLKSRLGA